VAEGLEERRDVVPVHHQRLPAERAPADGQRVHVVLEHGRAALAQPVDVDHGAQVVETVVGPQRGGLPHRTLGRLAVSQQHVGAGRGSRAARVERHAERGTDALAQGSGGDVYERQTRRRVALEVGRDLPQLEQPRRVERAGLGPGGVEDGGRVPLGQDEPVVLGPPGVGRVETHLAEEQRRDDFRGRAAARRVAASRLGRRSHRVEAEPGGDVVERGDQDRSFDSHS
jgi:hypothetical protein